MLRACGLLFAIDAGYEGLALYTSALDNRYDVPPVDIGYHYPGVVRFVDCGVAGAIFCYDYSDAAIENCTITQNTSDYVGGGIVADVYSDPQIKNSIVWDNDDFYGDADIDAYGSSVITVSYSDYGFEHCNASLGIGHFLDLS